MQSKTRSRGSAEPLGDRREDAARWPGGRRTGRRPRAPSPSRSSTSRVAVVRLIDRAQERVVAVHLEHAARAGHADRVARGAVAAEHERPDPPAASRGQHDRAGAVAEQRRGAAIVRVDEARRASRRRSRARARRGRPRSHAVASASAAIEPLQAAPMSIAAARDGAELVRNDRSGGGRDLVGGERRDEHEVELARREPGARAARPRPARTPSSLTLSPAAA